MKFICSKCGKATPVTSVQIERAQCRECCEYNEGYTVPECICDNYETSMVRVDRDTYLCPKCGIYRSSKEEHLTGKGNPGYICPVLDKNMDISDLEKSHWHYDEQSGYRETYIQISREAHKQLHNNTTLLEQERKQYVGNGIEAVLENLIQMDLARLPVNHSYHPYQSRIKHAEYVLARYGFPLYFNSEIVSDIIDADGLDNPPEELNQIRRRLKNERDKYF